MDIKPCNVLEIGCGTGNNSIWLAKKNFNIIGIDASEIAIQKALEKASKANVNCTFIEINFFRHARAMHLYQAGMPLSLVGEWLGHSQLETTLIYANADISMKQAALEKVIHSENSVFSDEPFRYKDNDEIIKKLYGLAD